MSYFTSGLSLDDSAIRNSPRGNWSHRRAFHETLRKSSARSKELRRSVYDQAHRLVEGAEVKRSAKVWRWIFDAPGLPHMKTSRRKITPKTRVRVSTGKDSLVRLRISKVQLAEVERWAALQVGAPGRSEAIRRLLDKGLSTARPTPRRNPKGGSKASEMAGKEIDRLADPSATNEERENRKRRLLKGPKEFRDIRSDDPAKTTR